MVFGRWHSAAAFAIFLLLLFLLLLLSLPPVLPPFRGGPPVAAADGGGGGGGLPEGLVEALARGLALGMVLGGAAGVIDGLRGRVSAPPPLPRRETRVRRLLGLLWGVGLLSLLGPVTDPCVVAFWGCRDFLASHPTFNPNLPPRSDDPILPPELRVMIGHCMEQLQMEDPWWSMGMGGLLRPMAPLSGSSGSDSGAGGPPGRRSEAEAFLLSLGRPLASLRVLEGGGEMVLDFLKVGTYPLPPPEEVGILPNYYLLRLAPDLPGLALFIREEGRRVLQSFTPAQWRQLEGFLGSLDEGLEGGQSWHSATTALLADHPEWAQSHPEMATLLAELLRVHRALRDWLGVLRSFLRRRLVEMAAADSPAAGESDSEGYSGTESDSGSDGEGGGSSAEERETLTADFLTHSALLSAHPRKAWEMGAWYLRLVYAGVTLPREPYGPAELRRDAAETRASLEELLGRGVRNLLTADQERELRILRISAEATLAEGQGRWEAIVRRRVAAVAHGPTNPETSTALENSLIVYEETLALLAEFHPRIWGALVGPPSTSAGCP